MKIDTTRIFNVKSDTDFESLALEIFKFQFKNNRIYNSFCNHLSINEAKVNNLQDIPFLPISFFKSKQVLATTDKIDTVFTSSGTTGDLTSQHFVTDISIYEKSYLKAFDLFYGSLEDYCILALLPSYLEREGSSLIYMTQDFIKKSNHSKSGFYLNDTNKLIETLTELERKQTKTLLIGVSFALLDLAESHSFDLKNTVVMETGGMKGRRKELIRLELHQILQTSFGISRVHSEYGMTELLSQAYATANGIFHCPPWMRVFTRELNDPLQLVEGKTGGVSIIDLANLYSCSFIATQDLGRKISSHSFEILGRFDHSDLRGCNLMVL